MGARNSGLPQPSIAFQASAAWPASASPRFGPRAQAFHRSRACSRPISASHQGRQFVTRIHASIPFGRASRLICQVPVALGRLGLCPLRFGICARSCGTMTAASDYRWQTYVDSSRSYAPSPVNDSTGPPSAPAKGTDPSRHRLLPGQLAAMTCRVGVQRREGFRRTARPCGSLLNQPTHRTSKSLSPVLS